MVSLPTIGAGAARLVGLGALVLVPPVLSLVSFGVAEIAALATYLAGLLVSHRTLARHFGEAAAFWSAVLLAHATPLAWHVSTASTIPLTAFLLSALAVDLALDDRRGPVRATGFGSLVGILARLVGLAAWPLLLLGVTGVRRSKRGWLMLLSSAALCWLGLPALSVGVEAASPAWHHLADGLFSSRHGILFWTPLGWAGLVAFPGLRRRLPASALPVTVAFWLLVLAAAATAFQSPGGHAGALFCSALPLLAPGLALLLDALHGLAARRPGRVLIASFVPLAAWNLLFMWQFWTGMIPRADPISFARVAGNNARLIAAGVGTPLAWPANWAFSAEHSLPPARYDGVVGRFLFGGGTPLGGVIDVGADRPLEDWLLTDGWSVRHRCGEARCREIGDSARLLVPIDRVGSFELSLFGEGEGTLALQLNGQSAGRLHLGQTPVPRVVLGAELWRPGLNELWLDPEGGRISVARLVFRSLD